MYNYVNRWVDGCVHTVTHVCSQSCRGQRAMLGILFNQTLSYFKIGSLTEPNVHQFTQACWQWSLKTLLTHLLRDPPVPPYYPAIYVDGGDWTQVLLLVQQALCLLNHLLLPFENENPSQKTILFICISLTSLINSVSQFTRLNTSPVFDNECH